jgi:DNA-binding response OmpR family regulator
VIRILLVEDHRFFAEAFARVLEGVLAKQHGERVTLRLAETVADGLRMFSEEGPFDLAMVDLVLPDGKGAEVVRAIKASSPETPVAVLSASWDFSDGLAAGADEGLNKTADVQELVAVLSRLRSGGEGPPA